MRSERLLMVPLTAVLVIAAACTGTGTGTGPAATGTSTSTPSIGRGLGAVHGRILLVSGSRGTDLSLLTLPAKQAQDLQMPTADNFLFGQAFLASDGTPYVLQVSPTTQLLALSHTEPPRPVGPRLYACAQMSQMIGHTVYVAECVGETMRVLDLNHPDRWSSLKGGIPGPEAPGFFEVFPGLGGPVAQGGSSAVSPDGTRLAFLLRGPDGLEVWERPLDGSGPPVRWLSLGRLPALRVAGIDRPKLFSGIVWGPGGLSLGLAQVIGFQFGSSSLGAIVTRSDDGRVRTLALGNLAPGAMAWQPGGHVIAFIDQVGEGGFFQARYQELRTIDVRTGTVRQLAASYGVFNGAAAWSPDGRSIAWSHGPGLLQVLDPTGRALGTLDVEGTPGAWVG